MFPKKVYMFCAFLSQTCCNKKTYLVEVLLPFYYAIQDQKYYYSNPIYRVFVKFIWIIVLASQVQQELFILGLRSHLS